MQVKVRAPTRDLVVHAELVPLLTSARREQTACAPCTAEAGHDEEEGDDPEHNQCGWCAANGACVPKRDGAISSAECPGFLTYSTDECGGGSSAPHGSAERTLRRLGVGVHVLNVGDVDLKAARFYADIQIFLHVEQTRDGEDKLYARSAILDPSLAECNGMPYWRQFQPTEEDLQRLDLGLFLVNIDRYRSVELVRHNGSLHHYRVQSNFYFRTNISFWPMNTERLEIVLETQTEAMTRVERLLFCTMPEYSGLSQSVRFPGSLDNQRLSYESRVVETCGPPFQRPIRQCLKSAGQGTTPVDGREGGASVSPARWEDGSVDDDRGEGGGGARVVHSEASGGTIHLFDQTCECDTVSDYREGYDRESCGCQGGRIPSSRLTFAVLYKTPEVGAAISAFMAPVFIMFVNLGTYLIPPKAIETRFSLSNSGLVALVLFHAGLKGQTPLTGVLTFADNVMIGCYLVLLISFVISAIILTLRFEERPIAAQVMFEWCRVLGPVYSILAFYGSLFSSMSSLSIIVVCVVIFLAFALFKGCAALFYQLRLSPPNRFAVLRRIGHAQPTTVRGAVLKRLSSVAVRSGERILNIVPGSLSPRSAGYPPYSPLHAPSHTAPAAAAAEAANEALAAALFRNLAGEELRLGGGEGLPYGSGSFMSGGGGGCALTGSYGADTCRLVTWSLSLRKR